MYTKPSRFFFIFCLLLLYITWGSAYIIVDFSLPYAPGLLLSAIRMVIAGTILIIFTRLRGEKLVFTKDDFKNSLALGFFLVLLASSFVAKGQETVSSGTTAMLLGIVPTWMILSDWYFDKVRPSAYQAFGILLGFGSIAWMQWYQGSNGQTSLIGFLLILISTLGWVYGSHLSTHLKSGSPMSILRSTGFMMFFGGIESFIFALIVGERVSEVNFFSPLPFILAIHIAFTMIGYVSYFWLLKNTRPMIAISYEFVNPVIALFLGWLLAGEIVDVPLVIACSVLVTSVFFAVANKHDK